MADTKGDVKKWLEHHHRVEDKNRTGGQEVHVFAVEQVSVYGEAADATRSWEIVIPIGPITITIVVDIDISTGTLSVCAYGKLPFLPQFTIGCATGSLSEGVILEFDFAVISGRFRFYISGGWLRLEYRVTVLGASYSGDVGLIPIPIA